MTQPLGQIKKPSQSLYTNKRKLLLVPNFLLPGNTDEQKKILGKYCLLYTSDAADDMQ